MIGRGLVVHNATRNQAVQRDTWSSYTVTANQDASPPSPFACFSSFVRLFCPHHSGKSPPSNGRFTNRGRVRWVTALWPCSQPMCSAPPEADTHHFASAGPDRKVDEMRPKRTSKNLFSEAKRLGPIFRRFLLGLSLIAERPSKRYQSVRTCNRCHQPWAVA